MKFKTRINLIIIALVGGLLFLNTIIILGFVSDQLKDNAEATTSAVEEQHMMSVEHVFDSLITMTQKPMINPRVLEILTMDFSQIKPAERSAINNEISQNIDDFFYTDIFYKNNFVYGVTLIPFNRDEVYYKQYSGKSLADGDLKKMPWYQEVLKNEDHQEIIFPAHAEDLFRGDQQPVVSVGRLLINPRTNQGMGVIRVDTSLSMLAEVLNQNKQINGDRATLLEDAQGQLLATNLPLANWRSEFAKASETSIETSVKSQDYGFTLYHLFPQASIYQKVRPVLLTILFTSVFCMLLALLIIKMTNKKLLEPIGQLNDNMKKVQAGDLSVSMPVPAGNGEFEEVTQSFNLMVKDTRQLVEQVRVEAGEKQRLEYQALQSQISPHFISNTISAIRWLAYMEGNQKIEKSLDAFYHLLNFAARNQEEKITIQTEFEQMQYYLEIISLRYPNKVRVTIHLAEEVKQYATIKYLVQTLVENSIFHGFKEMSQGKIQISVNLVADTIVYEVSDNGAGMTQARIDEVLAGNYQRNNSGGIGLDNINRRIKLIFGEAYGIAIDSENGEYTVITVKIPAERVL